MDKILECLAGEGFVALHGYFHSSNSTFSQPLTLGMILGPMERINPQVCQDFLKGKSVARSTVAYQFKWSAKLTKDAF